MRGDLNTSSGKVLTVFKDHRGSVNSAVFSPNGKYILTAEEDGTARIPEVASGNLLMTLTGHSGRVTSASFIQDDTQLVTKGVDRTLRLYRQEAFAPLPELEKLARQRLTRELSCDEYKQYLHVESCQ